VRRLPDAEVPSALAGVVKAAQVPVAGIDFGARPVGENRPQECFSALFMLKQQLAQYRISTPRFDFAARERLLRLYAASRRVPAAIAVIAACAIGLRIALMGHWDSYGALQLPLLFEAGAAAAITLTTASPLGEPERVAGRWLPFLRLAATLALTAAAAGALTAAGTGAHLAGGTLDVLRNHAGMTGIGLLCAAVLGGGLAWGGPAGYLVVGAYGLYTQWHGPALTTP
jgi:hypothetical protein